MRMFISKRLPLGFRAGVIFDPMQLPRHERAPVIGGVYVIKSADGMCKIGISTNPEKRLATLRTASSVELKLHYVLALNTVSPLAVEAEAHRMLQKYRSAGEWFDVPPETAEEAVNQAAARFGAKEILQTTSDKIGRPQETPIGKTIFYIFLCSFLLVAYIYYRLYLIA